MPPNEPARRDDRILRAVPALILLYFAVHVVLRVTAPGGLGLDEAEQMVATQTLEWGYGPQPPLYTWLQWAVFQVTGPGKFGLALLKNALLAAAYLALWRAALGVTGSVQLAAVASLSLMLVPPVAWEAQRALSHSVLAVAIAAALVWLVLSCRAWPGRGEALLAGVLVAAGLLAKGNFAYFAAGLAGAVALTPGTRSPRWLAGLAVAVVLVAPTTLWMLENPQLVTQSVRKFGLDSDGGQIGAAIEGLGSLVVAFLAFSALLLVGHGALFWWRRPAGPPAHPWARRFLTLWLAMGMAAVAISVVATGATEVKERWLQPVLVALPLALTFMAARRIDVRGARWLFGIVGVLALTVIAALSSNLRRGGDNPSYQSAPFAAVAAELPEGRGLALVGDDFLAGNLRLIRPGLSVLTPQKPALSMPGEPALAVWWSRDAPRPPPDDLVALVQDRTGQNLGRLQHRTVSQPYPEPHGDRTFHLHWAQLSPGGG